MSDIRLNFYQYSTSAEYQNSRLLERNFAKKWGEQIAGTDSQNRTARTEQADQAEQSELAGQSEQTSQGRKARTRLPGTGPARTGPQIRTERTGQQK
jgi:hypothetical protein